MNDSQNNSQHIDNSKKATLIKYEKSEMFAGPVPHPEIIERYEKIYPGAAKIIFEKWDSQVKHRHNLEKSVVWADNLKSILGVIFGFIAVMAAIGGGVYIALNGQQLFGGGLSLFGLAMLATAFITNRKRENK